MVQKITCAPVIGCLQAGHDRGCYSALRKIGIIATHVINITHIVTGPIGSWIGIVLAPFSLYQSVVEAKKALCLAQQSTLASDKGFWVTKSITAVGNTILDITSPMFACCYIAMFKLSGVALHLFKTILPIFTLVTGTIGLVASSWSLGRTIQDYTHVKNPETAYEFYQTSMKTSAVAAARFNNSFSTQLYPLEGKTPDEVYVLLKKGFRFSVFEQSSTLLSSSLAITAGTLALLLHCYIINSALIISSASFGIIPIIIRNILMKKSPPVVPSSGYLANADPPALSTSEAC